MNKVFYLNEICPNKDFAQKIITRYSGIGSTQFIVEMPQWMYINEFEPNDWATWWSDIYRNYHLVPGEKITIIIGD